MLERQLCQKVPCCICCAEQETDTLSLFKIPSYFAETPFIFVHSHPKRSIQLKLTECSTPSKAIHPLLLQSFTPTITATKKE